jgi:hypothetical protein
MKTTQFNIKVSVAVDQLRNGNELGASRREHRPNKVSEWGKLFCFVADHAQNRNCTEWNRWVMPKVSGQLKGTEIYSREPSLIGRYRHNVWISDGDRIV